MQVNNQILQTIKDDLITNVKNDINNDPIKEYKKYRGKVIDNKDPLQCSRVKVRVFGKYDDLDSNVIPWAIPEINFLGSTKGSSVIPEIGTIVKIEFDQNDEKMPIYSVQEFNQSNLEEMDDYRTEDYPDMLMFFETKAGDYFRINRYSGEAEFKHHSRGFGIDRFEW